MRITCVTRKLGNVECNSHCDVLHITPIRVARLILDCNGVFAIKAYIELTFPEDFVTKEVDVLYHNCSKQSVVVFF